MRRFFTFITCIILPVIIAGAVSDNVIIKVRRGENFPLSIRTSEPKIVSRLTVRKDGTQEIFRYCSSEEQNHGCKPINPERFSLQIFKDNVSVTVLDANTSDEGVYDVEVIDDKHNRIHQKFTVALTEQPFTTPAISTKGEGAWGIIEGIIGVTAVVIAGAIVITGIICYKKKKENNHIADDGTEDPGEGTSLSSNTNGAGELDTDESLEMVVVDATLSVDNEGPVHGA